MPNFRAVSLGFAVLDLESDSRRLRAERIAVSDDIYSTVLAFRWLGDAEIGAERTRLANVEHSISQVIMRIERSQDSSQHFEMIRDHSECDHTAIVNIVWFRMATILA